MNTEPNQLAHSFNHTADTEGNFNGLTKREYFAAMAMQGILSGKGSTINPIRTANDAVMFADELIKSLNL